MGNIIIAMPKREDAKRIAEIIRGYGVAYDITICSAGSAALREANERGSGVIIAPVRLKDMTYAELADYLPPHFGLLILTKNEALEICSDRMLRILLPLKVKELTATIETMLAGVEEPRKKKKKIPIKRNPEEQRTIDQAKQTLMEKKNMSEPEAFRFIQKQSMDTGRSMLESAQMILLLNSDWSS